MDGFRNALDELAEQAKVYDVTGRALRVARRRRRAVRLAPVAAATAVVLVGLVAVAGLRPDPSGGLEVAAPPTVDWLPERLELPATDPAPLPATGTVGRGVLLYGRSAAEAGPPVLLTDDGRQHRLAEAVTSKDGLTYTYPSLSPDGQWLGEQRAGRYVVRSLVGTARFELTDGYAPVAWSPDNRWLLLTDNLHETEPAIRLDLTSGARQPVPVGDRQRWRAVAVLPGGDVLLNPIWLDNTRWRDLDVRVVDPVTGLDRHRIERDLNPYLRTNEGRTWDPPRLSPDGRTIWLGVVRVDRPEQGTPGLDAGGSLLLVDLASGEIRRTDLPRPTATRKAGRGPTPTPPVASGRMEPIGYLPEGVLLRTTDKRGDALRIMDPETGATGLVTELPARGEMDQVLVRGS
ncbi:TolB family protein [Plantactinospora solaniradicis]|uniref:TolB family protein n=1 Tax=Plantactinospora solaniradicis TaxID=1723736 RepID=A0ABW1KEF5_9ACTN